MTADPQLPDDHSFVEVIDAVAGGLRLAVKDIIDMAGYKTTLGSRVVQELAVPADRDAACLAHYAEQGAVIVGRTNLHELAFGASGINSSMGTPVNPLGEDLIPGGSSSGNATALRAGRCDIAFGTDTGGSVRIPAACCGVLGLKTTAGLVPTEGVHPLAPTLDTVGPMAADPAMLRRGLAALVGADWGGAPGMAGASIRILDFDGVAPPVREALRAAAGDIGLSVSASSIAEAEWEAAIAATGRIIMAEAAASNAPLRDIWPRLQSGRALAAGARIGEDADALERAFAVRRAWMQRMRDETASAYLLTPTIECLTPTKADAQSDRVRLTRFTSPVNLAGLPAISVPVTRGPRPASVQLVGPPHSEHSLIDLAERIHAPG
ncbi:MAG: amidase [Frankiaceae bacterium]|nr:amidase [Frankiaceae bacterium]